MPAPLPRPAHEAIAASAVFASTLAAVLSLAGPSVAPAAESLPAQAGDATGEAASPGTAWFAIPVAFYLPETRFGFGAIGGVHLRFEPSLQVSDVHVLATATVKEQALLDLRVQLFPSEELTLGGVLRLSVYPDLYFGTGPETPRSVKETFTSRSLEVQLTPEWYLVPGRLRTGPRAWFRQESFSDLAPGGQLVSGAVTGVSGYASAGLGWSLTWDSRDNRFAPRSGSSMEAWYLLAPGAFGDRLSFGRGALDARQFVPLGRSVVLGLAGHLELAHGAVPVTLLPRLGGDRNLRGYFEGRWRDRYLYSGQAELRFTMASRFGAVVFAGLSDVAHRPSAFETRNIRPAAGVGGRFRLTDDGLNIRLDAGAGQEGLNVYLNLGEAF